MEERRLTARQQAEQDIRRDLAQDKKVFIPFYQELNRPMRQLVRQYLAEQKMAY